MQRLATTLQSHDIVLRVAIVLLHCLFQFFDCNSLSELEYKNVTITIQICSSFCSYFILDHDQIWCEYICNYSEKKGEITLQCKALVAKVGKYTSGGFRSKFWAAEEQKELQSYTRDYNPRGHRRTREKWGTYAPRNSQRAVIVWQIAGDSDSSPIISNFRHVSSSRDARVANSDWHFNPRAVDRHFAVREHLELVTTCDDAEALLDRLTAHRLVVVDDDAECSTDEVSHQKVGTVAGELEESTVERHEVLIASQTCVTCSTTSNNVSSLCLFDKCTCIHCEMTIISATKSAIDSFTVNKKVIIY